jgi:hypothetical protein
MNARNRIVVVSVLAIAVGLIVLSSAASNVFGRGDDSKASGGPHYSVVMTEGHNLLVTDNATNKIYFYTIDKDKPIGSPLKLRASVDLTKVGQEEIAITPHNLEGVK